MYVFPVRDDVDLPPAWESHVRRPEDPYTMDPQRISQQRDEWLRTWSDVTTR
jgi:thiamine transport system substrate-binding protein